MTGIGTTSFAELRSVELMDVGLRTPLLDLFRRGEADRDTRLSAARGALAPRAHEQVALLALLTTDPDPEVRTAAEQTIALIPGARLAAFLARPDVANPLRDFFKARGIQAAPSPALEGDEPLVELEPPAAAPEAGSGKQGTLERLAVMNISERIRAAMKGTREERAILIRDPNKLVSVAVLSSPKLTESEVEGFARMANVSEEVLRIIGMNRAWLKNYGVVAGLAKNPKTPLAVSLTLVQRLNDRDLKLIALDRNIQEPLKLAVRKRLAPR